MYTVSATP
ncbi:hypothetical protein D018_0672A, partial [Vibrio parahaemolyticus VP2007-007]